MCASDRTVLGPRNPMVSTTMSSYILRNAYLWIFENRKCFRWKRPLDFELPIELFQHAINAGTMFQNITTLQEQTTDKTYVRMHDLLNGRLRPPAHQHAGIAIKPNSSFAGKIYRIKFLCQDHISDTGIPTNFWKSKLAASSEENVSQFWTSVMCLELFNLHMYIQVHTYLHWIVHQSANVHSPLLVANHGQEITLRSGRLSPL